MSYQYFRISPSHPRTVAFAASANDRYPPRYAGRLGRAGSIRCPGEHTRRLGLARPLALAGGCATEFPVQSLYPTS